MAGWHYAAFMGIRRFTLFVLLRGLMALSLLAGVGPLAAVDVPNRNPPIEERAMREARAAIAAEQWRSAADLLRSHVRDHADDADAHNLLGYSLRQSGQHAAAQMAYERALQLDPAHQGAHEYMGELMLILGRRDRALFHLGELERLCGVTCAEYQQLKRAVQGQSAVPPKRW
jgi:cytochrome c-type biogenesis protein CcmH/NrfG